MCINRGTRRILAGLIVFVVSFVGAGGFAQVNDWENCQMIGQNKEAPHCTLMPYPDAQSALTAGAEDSPYYKSLNGPWKFNWCSKPSQRRRIRLL